MRVITSPNCTRVSGRTRMEIVIVDRKGSASSGLEVV